MRPVLRGVLGPEPVYDKIRWTSAVQALTGQSMVSPMHGCSGTSVRGLSEQFYVTLIPGEEHCGDSYTCGLWQC